MAAFFRELLSGSISAFPEYWEGSALFWERAQTQLPERANCNWEAAKCLFISEMKPIIDGEGRDQCGELKEAGAAQQYAAKFADLLLRILAAGDSEGKQRFMDGLKREIKIKAKAEHPKALREACRIAEEYDRCRWHVITDLLRD